MDSSRFDALTRTLTAAFAPRRSVLQSLGGGLLAALGAGGVEAKHRKHKKKHKKKCKGGCGANLVCNKRKGKCQAAPSVCTALAVCNEEPIPCGTSALGESCSCERTTEGNTACINFIGDGGCDAFPQECTTTQDCRDTVGFHFYCQAIKPCGCTVTTSRCLPECDNTNPGGRG